MTLFDYVLGLADDALILLGFAEFDHRDLVFKVALDAADRIQLIFERIALLHHPLRGGGVVPQIGVFGPLVELG